MAVEAAAAGILAAALGAVLAPDDMGVSLRPHPAWGAIILLAARHGSRGLAWALPAAWGPVAALALVGGRLMELIEAGVFAVDLAALVASVLVAWVSSAHEQRAAALRDDISDLVRRGVDSRAALERLEGVVAALRARAARIEQPLAFTCDVAAGLEGRDAAAGAAAALRLALARTGARSGMIQLNEGSHRRTLAGTSVWSLPDGRPQERDLSAPIHDDAGRSLGLLALRGVPVDPLRAVMEHDVAIIAAWCGKSLRAGEPA